jgi:N-carbamoyl-L-amino-acid hydrolase
MFEYEERSWLSPQDCDAEIITLLEETAQKLGYEPMRMPSGAGHDIQFFAQVAPAGLIFVPSVNGVSHAPDEWTHWHDIEKGANVLLQALLSLEKQV